MKGGEAFRRGGVHHRLGVVIRSWMERLSVPGVAVAVTIDGHAASHGFGVTSVEDPLATTDYTAFQVGSITKTFTAAALLRLMEDGLVELDAPVRTYVPALRLSDRKAQRNVTIRHLLTHTGGWEGDVPGKFGRGDDALRNLIAQLPTARQLAQPGAIWSYNNAGFSLAGRVVELVTGQPFEAALKDLILDPLGMHTSFMFPDEVIGHRLAAGHVRYPGGARVAFPWAGERAWGPAGGLISTADDLLRWIRLHLEDETMTNRGVISAQTVRAMRQPQFRAGSLADEVALSWLRVDVQGTTVTFHMGDTIVHQTIVVLVTDGNFGMAILSNADSGARLCSEVTDWALRHFVNLNRHEPAFTMSGRSLAEYRGIYECGLWRIHIKPDSGALLARIERTAFLHEVEPRPRDQGPIKLYLVDGDRVVGEDRSFLGPRGEFGRNRYGTVSWLRLFGRIATRVSPVSDAQEHTARDETQPPVVEAESHHDTQARAAT